ncbi:ABC transporter substrate-binding protein [Piscirickettsia litoralis]|uniref:Spermidine/putrescine ABC transporter substrate-binding protein n=1 Tax=Piscirickettsia litoralis TaxID=1891921 RepID=A0ABX3A294_9GAMM|nr:extracellular solute-binding protein [Piscirickettsia litoralis]ODN41753.1 hypothetical protein BGC07_00585 [Piscirickettsia litoralis]
MKLVKCCTGITALILLLNPLFMYSATELKVLEWEGYISPFIEGFEKYAKSKNLDVKVSIVKPFITNPEQIYNAMRTGKADVVTPTHNYYKMSKNKLMFVLQPIDTSKLSHYKDLASSLQTASYDQYKGQKYSVPLLGGSYGLAYNEDKVKQAPASWEVLWDSQYKDQYSITNDQFEANLYTVLITMGYPAQSVYDIDKIKGFKKDKKKIQEKLNQLVFNAKFFWGGVLPADKMPELTFGTTYWFGVAEANSKGQHWKLASPKEGQTVWLDTMALSKQLAKDPKKLAAAYLLLDYMISPEVQEKVHAMYGSVIVNGKTKNSVIGDQSFFKEEYFWKPLTSRTRNTYKIMWEKAMRVRGN